jgi:predicted CXXCH cytochrome family protein
MKNRTGIGHACIWGLAVLLLSQCSPRTGKNLLNFFFDGVPETDTVPAELAGPEESSGDSLGLPRESYALVKPEQMQHYPYEEGECASCHNERSLGTMVEEQPGLCYLCHEDLSEVYPYLHGPVAGGYCTSCHDPHSSTYPKLLRMTGDALCYYCHAQEDVLKNEMHQDLEGMLCMDCHNPHGGEDKYVFQ